MILPTQRKKFCLFSFFVCFSNLTSSRGTNFFRPKVSIPFFGSTGSKSLMRIHTYLLRIRFRPCLQCQYSNPDLDLDSLRDRIEIRIYP
jgi:hypothetical protein